MQMSAFAEKGYAPLWPTREYIQIYGTINHEHLFADPYIFPIQKTPKFRHIAIIHTPVHAQISFIYATDGINLPKIRKRCDVLDIRYRS